MAAIMPFPKKHEPIVLEACTIAQFLQYLMEQHASPTHLIVCSSRDTFLQDLLAELEPIPRVESEQEPNEDAEMATSDMPLAISRSPSHLISLLRPTLHFLATSRTITLAHCPDPTHLLAHLSALSYRKLSSTPLVQSAAPNISTARPILAILNPIRLHKPTSSFSAQGFNRTFASAIDTAHHLGQQLIFAEVESRQPYPGGSDDHDWMDEDRHRSDLGGENGVQAAESPWDEQLSMLNVTTKTFGVGERGWVGRTVSVRQVASRWCRFVDFASHA